MARLDATAVWFQRGEDAQALADSESDDDRVRRVPTLAWVAGAVSLTAVSFCAIILYGSHASASRSTPADEALATGAARETALAGGARDSAGAPAPAPPAVASETAAKAPSETRPATAPSPAKAAAATAPAAPSAMAHPAGAHAASPDVIAAEKLLRHGHAAAALTRFQVAIVHNGADQRALRGACVSLVHLSRLDDAARVCHRALARDPGDVESRRALASAYYAGGAYKWSAAEWRRVVEQSPRDNHARRALHDAETRAQKS